MVRELLEDYALFRKYKFKGPLADDCSHWDKVSINMYCSPCSSVLTFAMANEYYVYNGRRRTNLKNQVADLTYECQSCHAFERRFLIYVGKDLQTFYKAGQYPEWEMKVDKDIEKILGRHIANFKKGLTSEVQGYGIGAFAYYRRITEDIIDELLDSISDLIEDPNKKDYELALAKAKSTRVTQDKIDLVKDLFTCYFET